MVRNLCIIVKIFISFICHFWLFTEIFCFIDDKEYSYSFFHFNYNHQIGALNDKIRTLRERLRLDSRWKLNVVSALVH
jgi:hypothetical protein